ncbi:RNA polymerase sigma factor [Aureibaculum sp. 2210JD6-5]|uniref:RNA polymerase sigma factor n=1 Tax=Aureibaculum sp. 2210JD6-5 TaxID=3103957 RepID=UPI002AAC86E8|nr:RNA polymerase sigma factor [Aureibaculum sp. 2210JD6-5]MDY7395470.1 RNA polymerase sigma factor [Aureibaculum sp. 2210JD6-5]
MNKPEKIFDGLLVLQFKAGDKKAFALLVKRWHSKLCNQAFWYVKDADLAKDIVQESWSKILKKIHTLNETNNFGSWALKIVTRKSLDYLRKRNKEEFNLNQYHEQTQIDYDTKKYTENSDYSATSDSAGNSKMVIDCIKELPEQQQIVLRLFYVEEYKLHEIADILSLPKGTIKSRLFYAREKLKLIIKNRNYEK